jgi:hypothetical protein
VCSGGSIDRAVEAILSNTLSQFVEPVLPDAKMCTSNASNPIITTSPPLPKPVKPAALPPVTVVNRMSEDCMFPLSLEVMADPVMAVDCEMSTRVSSFVTPMFAMTIEHDSEKPTYKTAIYCKKRNESFYSQHRFSEFKTFRDILLNKGTVLISHFPRDHFMSSAFGFKCSADDLELRRSQLEKVRITHIYF